MYSSDIVERRLRQVKQAGLNYQRRPRDICIDITAKLEKLRLNANGEKLPNGQLSRELDNKELEFIASERILCRADFEYYLSRYHSVELDSGVGSGDSGIGAGVILQSQRKLIKEIGKREDEVHAEYAKYKLTEGIRCYCHKCRQVVFTSTARALTLHRMLFWPGTRCFAAALNPDGVGELYKRDKTTIDNWPFWLSVELYPDVKDSEIGFKDLNSRLLYQAENQKAGIGVGTQQDVSHLTEVPLWQYPYQIGFSFAPSLPKARTTLHIQEGTSAPYPYWQEVTEACRKKEKGYESWTYIFVPWYYNIDKYRSIPTNNWQPEKHTISHIELIERTSSEWCDGNVFRPSLEQMYWWETERAKYKKEGKLAAFLANYPATPEQSFTNWSEGALPAEVLERMELDIREPRVYEVHTDSDPAEDATSIPDAESGSLFPTALYVGGSSIQRYIDEAWEEIERDPRGLLLMWEPPRKGSRYIVSVDAAEGVTGWKRATGLDIDKKKDNGVVNIFRVDGIKELGLREENGVMVPDIDPQTRQQRILYKDVQAAEYAGPCDAVEIARVANVLGRIYAGSEEDQAELILESWPGCGMLTLQELLRLGYGNLWHWEYFADGPAEETNLIGWRSTSRSQQLLWTRSRRHIISGRVVIRSKFLLSELASAEMDYEKMRAKAAYGKHDDRLQTASMAFWAAHRWAINIERTMEVVTATPIVDYQRYGPGLGESSSFTSWKEAATETWYDD